MKQLYILLFIGGIILTACNKSNDPDVILNVEEEFSIILWEQLRQNTRDFQLNLQTLKKNFKCQNFEVGFDQDQIGNTLLITINDIIEPTDCLEGENKASGIVNFGKLPTGFYNLTIDLKDVVSNQGVLEINEDFFQLNMNSKDGIIIEKNQLYRIPDRLIWGYVQYQDQSVTDDFLAELDQITQSVSLTAGNYGYFNIENTNLTINADTDISTATTFATSLVGNTAELKILVKKYQEEFGNGLALKVYTFRGEEF